MPHYPDEIEYSEKYADDLYEYRHVMLPKALYDDMRQSKMSRRLLSEDEWRSLGVQQSRGWVHYCIHDPEPFILLFRRPIGTDPNTGRCDPSHPCYAEHEKMLKHPSYATQK